MTENPVLELEIRRKIYNHILKSPGLHERELSRKLNIPLSTLDYHLYHLKKRGLISPRSDGHYTRYYIENIGVKDKKVIGILRQKVTRKIIMYLLLNPNQNHKDICKHLGLAPSTTTFHLNKLSELEVTERSQKGRESTFSIKESDYISDLIITYRTSFLDKAVDQFIDTWIEINPENIKKLKKKKYRKDDSMFNLLLFWF